MERTPPTQTPGLLTLEQEAERYVNVILDAAERRKNEAKKTEIPAVHERRALACLARGQIEEALKYGIDLLRLPKPDWLSLPKEQWLEKSPLDRHVAIEKARADHLCSLYKETLADIPQGGKCLDIGCGSGFFLRTMQEKDANHTWCGIDMSGNYPTDSTDLDRKKIPDFQEYDGLHIPFSDHSMDAITLNCVLHHVPTAQLRKCLVEAQRVLKDGGKLLINEEHTFDIAVDPKDKKFGFMRGRAIFLRALDTIFYPDNQGKQLSEENWHRLIDNAGLREDGKKQLFHVGKRITGTYNGVGIPVLEASYVYEKRG